MIQFSKNELVRRKTKLVKEMKRRKLSAMLLFAQESMYWLTGYDTFGYCFFQCLVVRQDGEVVLLTRSADLRQAQHTSNIQNIEIWTDGESNPQKMLRDMLKDMKVEGKKVGVEYDTHGLTVPNASKMKSALRGVVRLEDASGLVHGLRIVKSEEEIRYVKRAARLSDDAFDEAIRLTKAGQNESKVLAGMQGKIFEQGGDYPANEFIIGSGKDALLCRYKSGRRKLSKNDQLTLEWSGTFAHYHAPMMWTIVVGKPKPNHQAYFEAAKYALQNVEQKMTPDNTFGNLFEAHATALDEAGLSNHRLNACGYNVGANFSPSWMDGPMFHKNNKFEIKPNMSLFAHMIIMDSNTNTAMCLGRSYITTKNKPKIISRHKLKFINV